MQKVLYLAFTLSAAMLATPIAGAGYITVSTSDGVIQLDAGELFGLLNGSGQTFSASDLGFLAATLNNDGINTEGKISFILTRTDAGLSFIGLFNDLSELTGGVEDFYFGLSSTTGIATDWFASNNINDDFDWYDLGNGLQMVNGLFTSGSGNLAGFAWGDVAAAPSATFNLFALDLTEYDSMPIQFITFDNDQWSVVLESEFSILGEYAFSYQYIPAPGTLALIILAGVTNRRRRRSV